MPKQVTGCDLCGDWPATLSAKCHPTAPLRIEMPSPAEIVLYCYIPACSREVGRFRLAKVGQQRAPDTSGEQKARDMLERLEHPRAQELSSGDLAELANLINDAER